MIWLWIAACAVHLHAQEVSTTVEQQLENLAEATETETEDDSYFQQLMLYRKQPLNLNTCSESELQPIRFLTDLQIQNFLIYRKLLGPFISFYELQAIPAWDVETIARLKQFVYVGPSKSIAENFGARFNGGVNTVLMRVSQTIEESKGYQPKDSLPPPYPGSPQRLYLRYKYVYKNLLQFGFLGEKDPGEQFFKGAQKNGFDFYSFHLFVRNLGVIRQLAIGDFSVNMGQGLLTYQSLAFRKSVDVMNIKRQTELFRPYNSAGESNFHRGVAITLGSEKWRYSLFASRQKVSSNQAVDSLDYEDYITSILNDGMHRTSSEVADRYNTTQTAMGGRFQYKKERLMLALNAVHYQLDKPLRKDNEPYNYYTFSGQSYTGISGEWGYTWRNMHWFGELATNPGGGMALVSGLMASLDPKVDISLLMRHIDKNYHTLYGNAFTESTTPINERGLYAGISIRPAAAFRIDAYADLYSFPWLRYGVDRPSKGSEYTVQLMWKPNTQVELYSRFRNETKAINYSNTDLPYHETEDVPRQNWRTNLTYVLSPSVTIKSRIDMIWYDYDGKEPSNGFTMFADVFYKPKKQPMAFNCRLQYFETDDYNSRLYAYENDVLYSYSIPAFYDKGYRGYFNLNCDLNRHITTWFRLARSLYTDKTSIGSGYDEIPGNHKTDYKVQVMITL